MNHAKRHREMSRRAFFPGATAALVVGGLISCIPVVNAAGAASTNKAKRVVVSTAENAKLGTILVTGTTVYTSSKGDCTGKCLKYWPEVLLPKGVTKATAGPGVSAAKLGTLRRAGGVLQVTYAGKALYRFSGDKAAGQVEGNGVKDKWGTWSVFVTAAATGTSAPAVSGPSAIPTTPPTAGTSRAPAASLPATTTPAGPPATAPTPVATTTPTVPTTTTIAPTTTTTAPSAGGDAF